MFQPSSQQLILDGTFPFVVYGVMMQETSMVAEATVLPSANFQPTRTQPLCSAPLQALHALEASRAAVRKAERHQAEARS